MSEYGRRREPGPIRGLLFLAMLLTVIGLGVWFAQARGRFVQTLRQNEVQRAELRQEFHDEASRLAEAALARGDHAGAVRALEEGLEGSRDDPDLARKLIQRLIEAHEAWHAAQPDDGHDREAAEWRVKRDNA